MRAEFTDDLITGNELIDSQHEELIGRINKLLDSCEAGEGKISAIKMLDYLAKYTDTHFGDEEALQKEVCYPDYDKHHAKHEEFKQTIQELNEMLQEEEGPSDAFVLLPVPCEDSPPPKCTHKKAPVLAFPLLQSHTLFLLFLLSMHHKLQKIFL